MSRLIYVPQYPVELRYQSWWLTEFTRIFNNHYDEVVVLGYDYLFKTRLSRQNKEMFSPIDESINLETIQMNEYMSLNIRDNDTLFLADISFPGLFCNVLYHKTCPQMYAFCHATSLNAYDYFAPIRDYKKKVEYEHARLFDGIFFGSNYSMNKTEWLNRYLTCHVVNLPKPPYDIIQPSTNKFRPIDIVSVCRPSIQKVNKKLEKKVERALGLKIHREEINSWIGYNQLLSQSKVLLISSKEDTFNYTVMDAIRCGCVPIVPNTLCFPEILESAWRYNDVNHLITGLTNMFVNNQFIVPKMICEAGVNNFFKNIIKIMKR
jgi:hypothetical protein